MKEEVFTGSEIAPIEIRTIEIAGLAAVLSALRLPHGLDMRSQVKFEREITLTDTICASSSSFCCIDRKDIDLMSRLVRTGDQHAKAVRGLIVYVEINAPRYFWQEFDTYRIGTDRLSSESTIHIQGKRLPVEELLKMKSELREGTMQKRIQMLSYQTLRRIYFQRHNHRLPQWHTFCDYIKSLPLAEELILTGLSDRKNGDQNERI